MIANWQEWLDINGMIGMNQPTIEEVATENMTQVNLSGQVAIAVNQKTRKGLLIKDGKPVDLWNIENFIHQRKPIGMGGTPNPMVIEFDCNIGHVYIEVHSLMSFTPEGLKLQ